VGRAIVGTAILKYPQWIKSAIAEFPGRLMASLDAVNGEVMIEGWQADSGHGLADAIKTIDRPWVSGNRLHRHQARRHLERAQPEIHRGSFGHDPHGRVCFGGISGLADIQALKSLESKGLRGAFWAKRSTREK
jgi:phosphoribosylformimino-5-aminoimidazole carboxamide ribotide isomerase